MTKIIFKVTHWGYPFETTGNTKEIIKNVIEDSGLFTSLGNSRIDGNPMYELKYNTRYIKLQKIYKKNDDLIVRLYNVMNYIKDDIEYVTINYKNNVDEKIDIKMLWE